MAKIQSCVNPGYICSAWNKHLELELDCKKANIACGVEHDAAWIGALLCT
uniref:Uncharacterized protein n=1 Tax=Anguilla anguilla TaxID=7936 RepID=A0A0E9RB65_ANGAN